MCTPPPVKALPWLLRVEQLVLGQWQTLSDAQVRCPACGSDHVGRKSAMPRDKKYYDVQGQLQTVAVYRYYCRNPQCAQGSFTNLLAGLLPYSPYRTEVHLLAVQMYTWDYSTYRRTGTALGVASLTAWRWVHAWGHALLPVAALFGLVRSSGVVGVDEKYVLVLKNDKPAGKCGAGCTSTWPSTSGPMICYTSPSIPTMTRPARPPFCWPYAPKATTPLWSSPTCARTTAR